MTSSCGVSGVWGPQGDCLIFVGKGLDWGSGSYRGILFFVVGGWET